MRVVHSVHERLRHRLHKQDDVVIYMYRSLELYASQNVAKHVGTWKVLASSASMSGSDAAVTHIEEFSASQLLRTVSGKILGLTA